MNGFALQVQDKVEFAKLVGNYTLAVEFKEAGPTNPDDKNDQDDKVQQQMRSKTKQLINKEATAAMQVMPMVTQLVKVH